MLRFDVFERLVAVERDGKAWRAYYLWNEGKRILARDLILPPDIPGSALSQPLADLAHECATPAGPDVRRLWA